MLAASGYPLSNAFIPVRVSCPRHKKRALLSVLEPHVSVSSLLFFQLVIVYIPRLRVTACVGFGYVH